MATSAALARPPKRSVPTVGHGQLIRRLDHQGLDVDTPADLGPEAQKIYQYRMEHGFGQTCAPKLLSDAPWWQLVLARFWSEGSRISMCHTCWLLHKGQEQHAEVRFTEEDSLVGCGCNAEDAMLQECAVMFQFIPQDKSVDDPATVRNLFIPTMIKLGLNDPKRPIDIDAFCKAMTESPKPPAYIVTGRPNMRNIGN